MTHRNEFRAWTDIKPVKPIKAKPQYKPPDDKMVHETSYSAQFKGEANKPTAVDNKATDRRRIRSLYSEPFKESPKVSQCLLHSLEGAACGTSAPPGAPDESYLPSSGLGASSTGTSVKCEGALHKSSLTFGTSDSVFEKCRMKIAEHSYLGARAPFLACFTA